MCLNSCLQAEAPILLPLEQCLWFVVGVLCPLEGKDQGEAAKQAAQQSLQTLNMGLGSLGQDGKKWKTVLIAMTSFLPGAADKRNSM